MGAKKQEREGKGCVPGKRILGREEGVTLRMCVEGRKKKARHWETPKLLVKKWGGGVGVNVKSVFFCKCGAEMTPEEVIIKKVEEGHDSRLEKEKGGGGKIFRSGGRRGRVGEDEDWGRRG